MPPTTLEFPRIAYSRCGGNRYRYVFAAGVEVPGSFFDKLVKIDLDAGATRSWYESGCYPGEPVFVHGDYFPRGLQLRL